MTTSNCAYCGVELTRIRQRRYCGPACARDFARLTIAEQIARRHARQTDGNSTWQAMHEQSPNEWDQVTHYSPSAFRVEKYVAVCMGCSYSVTLTEDQLWLTHVRTICCGHCGSRMFLEIEDVGGLRSTAEAHIRTRTGDRPLRTRVA